MSIQASKISIIMPVYKASSLIRRSVGSIIDQTLKDFELILVDDCGGDDSIFIAETLLKESWLESNYTIFKNEKNLGVAGARGKGMEISSGEYVIHLDSDDYFEPSLLEILYKSAVETDSDVVVCGYWVEEQNRSIMHSGDRGLLILQSEQEKNDYVKDMLSNRVPSALWNKLVKREVYESGEISFIQDLRDDLSVSPLLIMSAKKILIYPKALVHYVVYNSSSVSYTTGHLKLVASALAYLENRLSPQVINNCSNELLSYKVRIRRKLLLHKDMPLSAIEETLNLFSEVNGEILGNNNPEKKLHYRILARLSSKGNSIVLRILIWMLRKVAA